jgi:hypothetical protein
MRYFKILVTCLALLFVSYLSFATNPIVFSDNAEILPIGRAVSILEDPTNRLSLQEVMASDQFESSIQYPILDFLIRLFG